MQERPAFSLGGPGTVSRPLIGLQANSLSTSSSKNGYDLSDQSVIGIVRPKMGDLRIHT